MIRGAGMWGWIWALAAAAAHAEDSDGPPSDRTERLFADAAPLGVEAALEAPLDEILRELSARLGLSFIYDSRIVAEKRAAHIASRSSMRALKKTLEDADLELRRISHGTYVITAAAPAPAVIPAQAAAAPRAVLTDTIVVTAAASAGAAAIGSPLLFEIDKEALSYFSAVTADEIIFELPQTVASFTPANTSLFGGAAGLSLADMRGLREKRTLVLVNGRRASPTLAYNDTIFGVDLNRFAQPLIERIELETTSAGARRGSDAAAGVVNFVLRRNIRGLEAGGYYSITQRGDGAELSLHAIAGRGLAGGAGNVTVGLSYSKTNRLLGGDRAATREAYGFAPDGRFLPGFSGSTYTPAGRFSAVRLDDGRIVEFEEERQFTLDSEGRLEPFVGSPDQLFNALAPLTITPAFERSLGHIDYSHRVSPSAHVFLRAHGGALAADYQLAPIPGSRFQGADPAFGDAVAISLGNPTLPEGIVDIVNAEFADAAESVVIERRFAEFGPRRDRINRYYLDLIAGAAFGDPAAGHLEVSYRFGRTETVWRELGRIDRERLETALNPVECAQTRGCAPIDFFRPGDISPSAVQFAAIPAIRSNFVFSEHAISAIAGKSVENVPRGRLALRAGAELRRTAIDYADDTPAGVTPLGAFGLKTPLSSAVRHADLFGGADFTVLGGPSRVGAIDVSADLRTTFSSATEAAVNFEAGATWRPDNAVELFAHYQIGERAPNVVELFTIDRTAAVAIDDPCAQPAGARSPVVEKNCAPGAPLGVDPGFNQLASLAFTTRTGNPMLEPEDNRSFAAGATVHLGEVFPLLPGTLDITAAWHSYRIGNLIDEANDSLADCFESDAPGACGANPLTGNPLVIRDPDTDQIIAIETFLENNGELLWRGLDLEMRYALEPARVGPIDRLWATISHTYTDRAEFRGDAGAGERLDGFPNNPRHETYMSAGLERSRLGLVFQLFRRGRVMSAPVDIPEAMIPAVVYVDASLRLNLADEAYLQLGVENIFDRDPPIAPFAEQNTFLNHYDVIGRRFALSTRFRF